MRLGIFAFVFFHFITYSTSLLAQTSFPKYYADYELIENVDSLEKYVYAHQENQLAYMHGLISLEMSREAYKDKYGQNVSTIKKIAAAQNNELGKIMGLILEASTDIWTEDKTTVLAYMYRADEYFTKSKDTLGVLSICNTALLLLDTDNYEQPYISTEKNFKSWYQKAVDWGKTASQAKAKLIYYRIYLYDYFIRIDADETDFKEGFAMVNQALDIIKKMSNQEYHKYCIYNALSEALAFQKKSKEYLKYALLTYQNGKNLGYNDRGTAICNLGDAYLMNGQYKEAEKHYNDFYQLYKKQKTNNIHDEIYLLSHISETQYLQGKFKAAYNSKLREDSLKIVLQEKTKVGNILELETKYEVEKKDIQNSFLIQEKKGLESRNALLIIGIIVTSILSLSLIKISLDLKQANTKLHHAQQEIEKNSRFKQQLFHIIAHDLRSPIIAYSELTKTCAFLIKKNRLADLDTMGNKLDNIGFRLITLIDNLSLWSMSGKNAKEVKEIHLQALFDSILPIYKEIALSKSINLALNIQQNSIVLCDEQALLLIIRNFLDNAIKNSLNGETIHINVMEDEEMVQLHFINKPKAINPAIIANIKTLFTSDIQTEIDKSGLGLGLILVKEFATANNATVTLNENADGTLCFKVIFPKN